MKTKAKPYAYILLLFLVLPGLSAQQTGARGSSMTGIDITPNPVGRGDRFSVTILVVAESTENITVEAAELPENIVLLRGPYIRPVWISNAAGQSELRAEITYLYRSDATGRFEIGPYRITNLNRVYTTDSILLEVGVYRNRKLVIPLEMVWDIAPEKAYVGQNVLCVLKSLDERDIRMYDEPAVSAPSEGFFQPAEGVGEIRKYSRAGVPLYELPLAGYIFTPSTPGNITIPAATLEWESGRAVSDRVTLEVRALPEAVQESGAVGSFRMLSNIEKNEMAIGERVKLNVRIEGTGNLNFLQFPVVEAEGFSILGEDESTDFAATSGGYQGSREYTYTLLAEEAGEKTIKISRYPAVLPATGQVYALPAASYRLQVSPPELAASVETEDEEFPFRPPAPAELHRINLSSRYLAWTEYFWMLPGPVLFILFLVGMRKKLFLPILLLLLMSFAAVDLKMDSLGERLAKADEAYQNGAYAEAEYHYGSLAQDFPEYPDLYYAAGLSAYRLGKVGDAVWNTRTALILHPTDSDYREFLSYLSEQEGIGTTMNLPFAFHPDFFLFIITLAVNFAAFFGIFLLFFRKNAYFISAVLLLVVSIIAGAGMLVSLSSEARETAIVIPSEGVDAVINKIPRHGSSEAFRMKEGESVLIRGEARGFYFLSTSLGQKGWIFGEDIKMLPGPVDLIRDNPE